MTAVCGDERAWNNQSISIARKGMIIRSQDRPYRNEDTGVYIAISESDKFASFRIEHE